MEQRWAEPGGGDTAMLAVRACSACSGQSADFEPGQRFEAARQPLGQSVRMGSVLQPAAVGQIADDLGLRGPGRKYGTPVSGWQQQLVS